ncbi:MAG: thymidylate synthase [Candidatus Woykebacteria bacterium]
MTDKSHPEQQYLDLLRDILKNGHLKREFNSGIGIKSVLGRMIRFDLSQGFPLLTTKKVFIRGVIHELLWFLKGDSNIKYLVDNNVHIWDEWAYKIYLKEMEKGKVPKMEEEEFVQKIAEEPKFAKKWGELGPVYGVNWRRWPASDGREIDQLAWAIEKLKKTPQRKHVVISAWNPEYIYEMALPGKSVVLPACHTFFQLNVDDEGKLSLELYMRSADIFLGVPFNIASYSLLLLMIAQVTGFKPGEFILTWGDVHIYENHFDAVREQLKRKPKPFPKMKLNPKVKKIDDFIFEDFTLEDYDPHPTIKAEVTVVGGF